MWYMCLYTYMYMLSILSSVVGLGLQFWRDNFVCLPRGYTTQAAQYPEQNRLIRGGSIFRQSQLGSHLWNPSWVPVVHFDCSENSGHSRDEDNMIETKWKLPNCETQDEAILNVYCCRCCVISMGKKKEKTGAYTWLQTMKTETIEEGAIEETVPLPPPIILIG